MDVNQWKANHPQLRATGIFLGLVLIIHGGYTVKLLEMLIGFILFFGMMKPRKF
jgi:hypothetical protein